MNAPCLHLDGLVNDLDTPIFFEPPPYHYHEVGLLNFERSLTLAVSSQKIRDSHL